jgi:steroid 5-alpha reductase family enzyme
VLPPLPAIYWWAAGPLAFDDLRCWLVLGVILVWSVRLTANWIYAFPGFPHEDWRYPLLREGKGALEPLVDLFGIHLIPTWQVFLGMTPVYLAVTRAEEDVGWIDAVAVVIGLGAEALDRAYAEPGQSGGRTAGAAVAAPVTIDDHAYCDGS